MVTPRHGEPVLDPENPVTVRTAFGDRSVLEMPGYSAPWWLLAPRVEGRLDPHTLRGETTHEVPVTVWSPVDLPDDDPAPMLLVHDGAEYDQLAGITAYSGALVAAGQLPPHRLALAHPVIRDAWYSGSPQYLRTIAAAGLDGLGERYAVRGPVVVVGASLGGLTALLLGLLAAPRVGGVYAQSGSFFQVRHDEAESGYRYFGRISRSVQAVLDMRHAEHPLTVGMSCGALEENVANNRDMAAALRRAGHDVALREVPDLHNYTAWRDALDPGLTDDERRTVLELIAKGSYGSALTLATDDLDGLFKRLVDSGADVLQEPMDQPYGVRDCAFRDPTGNLIRINEVR